MKSILPIFLLLTFLVSCSDNSEELAPIRYEVPAEVEPLVQEFIAEAKKRGLNLVIDNLIVELTTPVTINSTEPACGKATGEVVGGRQNIITLNIECQAWRNGGESREILVFHELGHAILKIRNHRDGILPNGAFKSILFGGSGWNVNSAFYINDLTKREYYLDELFDETTPVPDWAK